MINLRSRKVLRDLWSNKPRVLLVVLSITMGLFAISTVFRAQAILARDLNESFLAINPASATLFTQSLAEDFVDTVDNMPNVQAAEGHRTVWTRLKVGHEWRSLRLIALSDYDDIEVNKVIPAAGQWPPPARTLLLERSSLAIAQTEVGQTVLIEAPNGRQRTIEVAGLAHDLSVVSGNLIDQVIFGYISLDTLAWLGLSQNFNEIAIVVAEDKFNQAHIEQVAQQVSDDLEKDGQTIFGAQILKPGKHQLNNVIETLLLILGSLGALSLVLSSLLVYNTISALLARQSRQIGVMKAIGAPKNDILAMYLATILIFSLLALLISIPLGILGAQVLTMQLANLLNFDIQSFRVPLSVIGLEILIGLLTPLAAALYPVIHTTRITVRQAIGNQESGRGQFGGGFIDTLATRIKGLPPSTRYAFRNIFRRKTRLALTLVTLAMGGAIFITVLSVRASLFLTIDDIAAYWQQDVTVDLQRPYRIAKIEQQLAEVAGITNVEGWIVKPAFRLRPDGSQSNEEITIFAPPLPSRFLEPMLLEGRWLLPEDQTAIVINIDFSAKEADIKPGDWISLKIEGQKSDWQVVGIAATQLVGFGDSRPEIPMAYTSYAPFSQAVGEIGLANRIAIETKNHQAEGQLAMKQTLEDHFEAAGVRVRNIETNAKTRTTTENLTNPLLLLLVVMAILFAAVGGLSLMGTMSLNVLERTQEIGIMRAVGASSGIVIQVVVVEGIFVGVVSWVLSIILAYPLSKVISIVVGLNFIKIPLTYVFASSGILFWLVIVMLLAALASYLPARNASRLSVREVLAYE